MTKTTANLLTNILGYTTESVGLFWHILCVMVVCMDGDDGEAIHETDTTAHFLGSADPKPVTD